MRKMSYTCLLFITGFLLSGCILSFSPSSQEVTITVGNSCTFEISTFGTPTSVTWSLDGTVVSNAASLTYTYTPDEGDIGDHVLAVTETSQSSGTDTQSWTVQVQASGSGSGSLNISDFAESTAASADTYDSEDILENNTFDYIIAIDFTANTAQPSSGSAESITTDGVNPLTIGSTAVTVANTDYGITITSDVSAPVRYDLSGTLAGTLTVSSSSQYQIYLDGVNISGSDGPAFDLESSRKVFIVTAPGTNNTLSDQSTRDEMTMKAALYGKGPMIFSGQGTLSVTGNYKHGLYSKDYIRVCGGTLDVTVNARDAVRSVNGFIFDDGVLTINGTGTVIDDESKGIKVEGSESEDGAGKGYVVINGGYITVTSVGKAITAGWDIDDDMETTDTSDDPSPYVEVNNGVITLTTTGTPYENADGTSLSPEGIEGKSDLTINSGYITINTTDDCLNAGNSITIDGGYIYCASSDNDAVDSNGSLTISGGVLVAIGSSQPEGPFDCDNNTFAITGGTVVGIGGTTSRLSAGDCTQNVVVLGSLATGRTMAVKANNGSTAFAFTIPKSFSTMVLSGPDIETNVGYTVYTGGTASADIVFNGLYIGNINYTSGTASSSFTVSSSVTNLGGVYF